jgi:hypothetical protein
MKNQRFKPRVLTPEMFRGVVTFTMPPQRQALICPKGYGLCWTCSTWCDMPQSKPAQRTDP